MFRRWRWDICIYLFLGCWSIVARPQRIQEIIEEVSTKKPELYLAPQNSLRCKWFNNPILGFNAPIPLMFSCNYKKSSPKYHLRGVCVCVCMCTLSVCLEYESILALKPSNISEKNKDAIYYLSFKDQEIEESIDGRRQLPSDLRSKWTNTKSSISAYDFLLH